MCPSPSPLLGLLGLAVAAGLAGCASETGAIGQTVRAAFSKESGVEQAILNPEFRYLRVTIGGRVALLVLGYVEPGDPGPIEVWYSAEREVLRLQNGRVVGAVGTLTEWRNVKASEAPQWTAVARATTPARWMRTRDVMPGYRYGMREALALTSVPAPAKSALRDLDPTRLAWFEERVVSSADGETALAPARYAVSFAGGSERVVYGEQCLAPETCFTWQLWPARGSVP